MTRQAMTHATCFLPTTSVSVNVRFHVDNMVGGGAVAGRRRGAAGAGRRRYVNVQKSFACSIQHGSRADNGPSRCGQHSSAF